MAESTSIKACFFICINSMLVLIKHIAVLKAQAMTRVKPRILNSSDSSGNPPEVVARYEAIFGRLKRIAGIGKPEKALLIRSKKKHKLIQFVFLVMGLR